jgi:hypothetical protein
MMRGDPIEKEVQLLLQSSGGSGHDALVDAALISLPEDAIKEGTWTHPQLHSKASFLVHFSRILVLSVLLWNLKILQLLQHYLTVRLLVTQDSEA